MDTTIISLDIETYGAVTIGISGKVQPTQRVFHPTRSMITDRVELQDLNITASITLVRDDLCNKNQETQSNEQSEAHTKSKTKTQKTKHLSSLLVQVPSVINLKCLEPQSTMVFKLGNPLDRINLFK